MASRGIEIEVAGGDRSVMDGTIAINASAATPPSTVMGGLDPAIHATAADAGRDTDQCRTTNGQVRVPREIEFDFARDGRVKPDHDDRG